MKIFKLENAKLISNKFDKMSYAISKELYEQIDAYVSEEQKLTTTVKTYENDKYGTQYIMNAHYASVKDVLKLNYIDKDNLQCTKIYNGVVVCSHWTFNDKSGIKLTVCLNHEVEEKDEEKEDFASHINAFFNS
jgi:hypothetical protein